MNTFNRNHVRAAGAIILAATFSVAIGGCASAPPVPDEPIEARSKLSALKSDRNLASQVPVEIREAEAAVVLAEAPVGQDNALGKHRLYMADQMVEIAAAKAATGYAEAQRSALAQKRDEIRLNARTREADKARRDTQTAQAAAEAARTSAANSAAEADAKAMAMQKQIDALEAEATDRGLVLTLGDVLFATGRSDLKSGGNNTLDKLIVFLNEYPDRNVAIEGHTDDVGSLDMNQVLSQSRADAVRTYLTQHGIRSVRVTAFGMGETRPIADNLSSSGRQQNRRVEIIIKNAPAGPAVSKL